MSYQNKNKSLKRLFIVFAFFVVFGLVFYFVPTVFANSPDLGVSEVGDATGLGKTNIRIIIGNIIRVILGFLGVIALSLVIYGGYLYMTSGGAEDKVAKAKKYLINAAIGLVIIFSAYAIVTFIMNRLLEATGAAGTYQCSDGKDNDGDGLVDFPNDDGCSTETDYSEYGSDDLNIVGGGQLRAKSITPQGQQAILNVHPRVVLNRKVQLNSVTTANFKITYQAAGEVVTIKPDSLTESNGNEAEILGQIMEDDDTFNEDWVVCNVEDAPPAHTYLGATPMIVHYDLSGISGATAGTLKFDSQNSGGAATMNIYCGSEENPNTEVRANWLPPVGENEIDLPVSCLSGDDLYIKWQRVGSNCLKFDYMWVDIAAGTVEMPLNVPADGSFVLKNDSRVIEFIPSGECSEENPDAYGLKKNTEYTITLKTNGLQSVEGYGLSCGAGSVCLAKFTTGAVCDKEAPQVIYNNLHDKKSICKFPEDAADDFMVSLQAIDDSGVSVISLSADENGLGSEGPAGDQAAKIFDAFIPWDVNNYALGAHELSATAEDIDGNSKTKDITVYLKPDFCCDGDGEVVCGDPACGACDGDVCTEDADCAHGECIDGKCVSFPVINNMNPKEGVDGNLVTIVGSGFGQYDPAISKVYFSDGTEAGKYSLEAAIGCDPSDAWGNTQLIVKVPDGVGVGPIKVVNKDSKEDDSENEIGWQGEFILNPNLKYPGLCSLVFSGSDPEEKAEAGIPTTLLDLGGEGFGVIDAASFVYFGSTKGTLTGGWSDTDITNVRVPQINKGPYNVVVAKGELCQRTVEDCEAGVESCFENCAEDEDGCVCSDIISNPLNFKITEAAVLPTITNIDPKVCKNGANESCQEGSAGCSCLESAPAEQLITISGTNFGDAIGQVLFIPLQDDGEGGFVPAQTENGNEEPAFIGALACGAGSWSDTQIVIKVPESKLVGGETIDIETGNYWVKIVTAQSLPSNDRDFVINDNAPGPGLCSINPNNGPTGLKFDLNGENLGNDNLYDLSFVKKAAAVCKTNAGVDCNYGDEGCFCVAQRTVVSSFDDWDSETVDNAVVPENAMSGGVKMSSADGSVNSNSVQFNVGACSESSCGDNEFCCYDGVCRATDAQNTTKEAVCGGSVESYESEFAWVMSTGVIPKTPKVIERSCLVTDGAGYPQSPSPAKGSDVACPNAMISATFNMLIDESSLDGNVVVKRCANAGQEEACDLNACLPGECISRVLNSLNGEDVTGEFYANPLEVGVPSTVVCTNGEGATCSAGSEGCVCAASAESLTSFTLYETFADIGEIADGDVVKPQEDNYKLYPDTWYQIEILGDEGGIEAPALPGSSDGKEMVGNYVWRFKTRATDCVPNQFLMKPARGQIAAINDLQDYWVTGIFNCQEISMANENWSWSVNPGTDADKAENKGYVCLADNSPVPYCPIGTGKKDKGVYGIKAAQMVCEGGCNPYIDEDCECSAQSNVETTEDDLVQILAQAAIGGSNYAKSADMAIDFGDPRVVSFFPNCNEACINAQIGANFNVRMKASSLEDVVNNIKIYSCFAKECLVLTPLAENISATYTYNAPTPDSIMQSQLTLDLSGNLLPNKYYRVVLSGEMESYSGVKLTGLNYADANLAAQGIDSFSWIFKTKNDPNECVIDTVGVEPVDYLASTPGETIKYVAKPRSAPDACDPNGQPLNPFNYDWDWSTSDNDADADPNNGSPLAFITNNTYSTAQLSICTDKCVLKGSQQYLSVCGNGNLEPGEECEFNPDGSQQGSGFSCNQTTCLIQPFANCSAAQTVNCCGNGITELAEQCDQGCEYKDAEGKACLAGTAGCSCVALGSACTAGCLNAGTATGYVCGNSVVEPGEDVDDGNKTNGDGVSSICLNEGSKVARSQVLAVCGDGVVEGAEECDEDSDFCSDTCTRTGFATCGNGTLEGEEECEKNSCYRVEACGGVTVDMAMCVGAEAQPNCSVNESGLCVCSEANSCTNGQIEIACAAGTPDCVCSFPSWCTTSCLNKGSNPTYGSLCGNGVLENGEDNECENGGGGANGSPYQIATINNEKNGFDVYSVILTLAKDAGNPTYSKSVDVIAHTTETINNQPEAREGAEDLTFRVSEAVYNEAVTASCTAPTSWNSHWTSFPANNSVSVCRNAVPVLSTDLAIQTDGSETIWYFENGATPCPAEYPEYTGDEVAANTDLNWFEKAVDKVKTFVHKLLFKVGLAEAPFKCLIPSTVQISTTPQGTVAKYIPQVILPANKVLKMEIKDIKNNCGVLLTPNPLVYTLTTGSEVCRLNNVTIDPSDMFVMRGNIETHLVAAAKSDDTEIFPMAGVYDWTWSWQSSDTALANFTASTNSKETDITSYTKNGKGLITATATIGADTLGIHSSGGSSFSGYSNITVFLCDNPWFGDVTDFTENTSYNSIIPQNFSYSDPTNTDGTKHKKFDINYVVTNDGSLQPSYLVEKEFNVGLFYCRDFGTAGNFEDDLPLIGLGLGQFTEISPEPRFGVYFDKNFDYVKSAEDFDFMSTGAFTISSWVYNDDLPVDRYVRLFYKNLSDGGTGSQDHVEIALRSWANSCDVGCSWSDVLQGTKTKQQCGCDDPKRSVVFRIKKGGTTIYKGIRDDEDLLTDGFNNIALRFDGVNNAELFINGNNVTASMSNETLPMYVWPRDAAEATNTVANDFKKVFIGGLGKTGIPLTSFGGYVDEVRIWEGVKNSDVILSKDSNDDSLKGYWNFNTDTNNSKGAASVAYCTADYVSEEGGSKCLAGTNNFAHINITDVAKEKGLLYVQDNPWLDISPDIENQCNDGVDNDLNGLVDTADPKCKDAFDGWEAPALFAQYFFIRKEDGDFAQTNDYAPDAISLRVYENPEYLRPQDWYSRYAPNPASGVQLVNSDCMTDPFGEYCYKGIKEGRSVYVAAANVNGTDAYNNIYLLSYSQGANAATQNIYSQLLQFLKFNMNILDGASYDKIKVVRDSQRTTDLVLMRQYLDVYRSQNGQVPQLEGGTLDRNNSTSVWDSWTTELGVLGTMPKDPLNKLAWAPPTVKCHDQQGVQCNEGDQGCVCDPVKTIDCGFNAAGAQLACLKDVQQCAAPGQRCVLCSDIYDPVACYQGSTQNKDIIYTYNSMSAIPAVHAGATPNYVYFYNANPNNKSQYSLRVNFETGMGDSPLKFRYVPEYDTGGLWDKIKVEPAQELADVEEGAITECSDGIDNDGNGLIDYPNDALACESAADDDESYAYQCKDGVDNDGDGTCDFNGCNGMPKDPSCTSDVDNDETYPAQCNDGVDNDNDDKIDFCKDDGSNAGNCDSSCLSIYDDHEAKNVLFTFFVDTSGSMNFAGHDPEMVHRDLIKSIINGIDVPGDHIDGVYDVMGDSAYYLLGTSNTTPEARKKYFPAGQRDDFVAWLDSNPYSYNGAASMALRVYNIFYDAMPIYDSGQTQSGENVNFTNFVYVIITDADDVNSQNERDSVIQEANERSIPLHVIYIKDGVLSTSRFNFWYRYHGLCGGATCQNNYDCASCLNNTNCSNSCVNNVCTAPATTPTVCVANPNHQGVWMQGSVANLEQQLPALISKFTTLPPPEIPEAPDLSF